MKIPKNIEVLAVAALPLIGLLILSIIVFPFGVSQVTNIRNEISDANTTQNTLNQKISTLTNVANNTSLQSDAVTSAVPSSNPSLITLSQVKILADKNDLNLSSIKGGSEVQDKTGLSATDVSFDISGPRNAILTFFADISNISPISVITKVKLNESGTSTLASVTVRSFWAALPKKIPAVTDPDRDLTADEKTTISNVASLIQPQFTTLTPTGAGRSDPFTATK